MSQDEWEALCDGCGKCCLNKLEDADTGEVALTQIACRLFDDRICRCAHYQMRHAIVKNCIKLSIDNLKQNLYWLPSTCAYRLLWEGKPLFDWHPLISGECDSVHVAGVSMQNRTIPEYEIHEDDWKTILSRSQSDVSRFRQLRTGPS